MARFEVFRGEIAIGEGIRGWLYSFDRVPGFHTQLTGGTLMDEPISVRTETDPHAVEAPDGSMIIEEHGVKLLSVPHPDHPEDDDRRLNQDAASVMQRVWSNDPTFHPAG